MLTVNEPQIWTLIGVFGAALFGMLTLMSTMFIRIVRTEIGSVRNEIGSVHTVIGSVRNEMGSLRHEMESIRHEVTGIHRRIDRLDGDINALMRHTFGAERE
ncbi:septal ring factor EnvC (AmiA/AmiB activator) [Microbacterium resistens]|uniref:Septal ring factor EnvC (AmiA/AmiB activator) n=1 Tax=Microbacterium resistens TaxID=156977 RepID=A0ABU1SBG3_9MICO|nr:hypothetical protein [Microbacterium resistens]MDR6866921.1 septal ring factor EnvC (AmiA/AmiB activator) [Microbacterium resistens]